MIRFSFFKVVLGLILFTVRGGDAQHAAERSRWPVEVRAISVQSVSALDQPVPTTFKLLNPAPGTSLGIGFVHELKVDTGRTDAPIVFGLVKGPAVLTGNGLLPLGKGLIEVSVKQAGNNAFLPLDARLTFNAVERITPGVSFSYTTGGPHLYLEVGREYAVLATTGHRDAPILFTLKEGPAVVRGNSITFTNGGTANLLVEQAGNQVFLPLSQIMTMFAGKPSTVTWLAPASTVLRAGQPHTLEARTSHSDAPVVFRVVRGPATLQGNQLTPKGPGQIRVEATQAGNREFSSAWGDRLFFAFVEHQTLEWEAPPGRFLELHKPHPIGARSSAGLPVTVEVEGGPALIRGGELVVTNAGSVHLLARQAGTESIPPAESRRHFNAEEILLGHGAWPGYPRVATGRAIDVAGDYIFMAADEAGLAVLDHGNFSDPERVGGADTPGLAKDVHVVDGFAYVADDSGGLRIFDVSVPQRPVEIASLPTAGPALGVFVMNQLAFVGAWTGGFQIFDVRDPAKPKLLSTTPTWGVVGRLRAADGIVYAPSGWALELFDVSNPSAPVQLSSLPIDGFAQGVELSGQRAYVAADDGGMQIVDISDPKAPVIVGAYPAEEVNRVRVEGNRAFIADGERQVLIVDVTDPSRPTLIAQRGSVGAAHDARAVNDRVFVALEPTGMEVWTIDKDSGSMARITGTAREIHVEENRAYLADSVAGLRILDVADRDNPRLLGEINLGGFARSVAVAGNHAYVANGWPGVYVVDAGDITKLKVAAGINVGGHAYSIRVSGQHAFAAAGDNGLVVLDISKPSAPATIYTMGRQASGGTATDVEVNGTTAYLCGLGGTGFQVLDIRDPAKPVRIGGYKSSQFPSLRAMAISGTRAFIAAQNEGIVILDLREPSAPAFLGAFDTEGSAWGIEAHGDLVYVSDQENGLLALDVSDPSRPRLLQRFDTPGNVFGFRAFGGVGYILDGQWGLKTVEMRPRKPQRIEFRVAPDFVTTEFPMNLDARASSGLPVTYRIISGDAALEAGKLSIVSPGEVVIRAEQAGNDEVLGEFMERTFRVSLPRQNITWIAPARRFLDLGISHPLEASASGGAPVTFRVLSGPARIDLGSVTVTNGGTVRIAAEAAGGEKFGPAISTRTFNISGFTGASATPGTRSALGAWPGFVRGEAFAVQVIGQYAYVKAFGLRIFDVADPRNPIEIGRWSLPNLFPLGGEGMHIAGGKAYVADFTHGLWIIDITNPALPVLAGSHARGLGFPIQDVTVEGNLAYLSGSGGVVIVDVSDPARTETLGVFGGIGQARQVRIAGSLAYVAAQADGLLVLDVSNPRNPALLGSLDTSGSASGVFVAGQYAYVADGPAGLQVVDVSDPAKPVRAGGLDTRGAARRVKVLNGFAYVADSNSGIQVIDVTVPAAPKLASRYDPAGWVGDIDLAGTFAYAADAENGFTALEIRPGGSLVEVGSIQVDGHADSIDFSGGTVFLADSMGGLRIIDASEPARPKLTGQYHPGSKVASVRVAGNLAYVGTEGLDILDVSRPEAPRRLGSHFTWRPVRDLAVQGSLAYLSVYSDGLAIVDVSNPRDPVELGSYSAPGQSAYSVAVEGRHAFLGSAHEVTILDVSDPSSPQRVAAWPCDGIVYAIEVAGTRAYAGDESGLQIVDISNPLAPVILGSLSIGRVTGLHADGNHVYLAANSRGLVVADVSDPARPLSIATVPTERSATGVFVEGDIAYMACGDGGLQILKLEKKWQQDLIFQPPLELTASSQPFLLEAISSSGLPVDFSIVKGPAVVEQGRLMVTGTGDVVVRASQAGDVKYLSASVDRLIRARLRSQSISWRLPASTQLNLNEAYPARAESSSGLPVVLRLKSGPALFDGSAVTVTNFGPVVLTAEQAGNAEFAPAEADLSLNATQVSLLQKASWPVHARSDAGVIRVSGDHAYIAGGSDKVMIFDISDLDAPKRVGSIEPGASASLVVDLRVIGPTAFLADRYQGLRIVDVSDPSKPVELGRFPVGATFWGLDVQDGLAYLAAWSVLHIVDVRDLANPRLLGSCATTANAVAVRDGVAYVAAGSEGLVTVDVSNPSRPIQIIRFNLPGYGDGVALQGRHAFIAHGSDGFTIADISDPGAPRVLGRYGDYQSAYAIQLAGGIAYVAGSWDVIQVVDISDPALPVRLGHFHVPQANVEGLYVKGNRALVGARWLGLLSFDISNASQPALTRTLQTSGFAGDVAIAGGRAFLADGNAGLQILDVTQPGQPSLLGRHEDAEPWGIEVRDNIAFLGESNRGLQAVDVADPRKPSTLGSLELPGNPDRLRAGEDGLLYVASGDNGMQIVRSSDPSKMELVGNLGFNAWTYAVDVEGSLACAATRAGLRVADVSTPSKPRLTGFLPTRIDIRDVDLVGTFAYLANGADGLKVADLSQPDQPVLMEGVVTGGEGLGVFVSDGLAWLADGRNGLAVFDVTNPASPALVASIPIPGKAARVRVEGNTVYVAAGNQGLVILDARIIRQQSIFANWPNRLPLSSRPFPLAAAASSGLPVTISVVSGPARLAGGQIETAGLGQVLLRLAQAGNGQFLPVSIQRELEIVAPTAANVVEAWIAGEHPDIPPTARGLLDDADADGVPNVIERLLSGNPAAPNPRDGRMPQGRLTRRDGRDFLEVSVAIDPELSALADWQFESTSALSSGGWRPVPPEQIKTDAGLVTVTLPAGDAAQFLRLRVSAR